MDKISWIWLLGMDMAVVLLFLGLAVFVCFFPFHSGLNLGVGHRMEFFKPPWEKEERGFICVTLRYAGTDRDFRCSAKPTKIRFHIRVVLFFLFTFIFKYLVYVLCQILDFGSRLRVIQ